MMRTDGRRDTLAKFVTRGAQSDIFYEVGSLIARAFRPWFIIAATQRAANRRWRKLQAEYQLTFVRFFR